MKKKTERITAALVLVLVLVLAGCATGTPRSHAIQAALIEKQVVELAMRETVKLKLSGKLPDAAYASASAAYARYVVAQTAIADTLAAVPAADATVAGKAIQPYADAFLAQVAPYVNIPALRAQVRGP